MGSFAIGSSASTSLNWLLDSAVAPPLIYFIAAERKDACEKFATDQFQLRIYEWLLGKPSE